MKVSTAGPCVLCLWSQVAVDALILRRSPMYAPHPAAHLSDEAYQQFFDQAVRLNELCGRLSDASGAAAAAIATERARQPGEE